MNARPVTAVSTGLFQMLPANSLILRPTYSVLPGTSCTRDRHGFVGQEKVLPRLSPEALPRA